MLISSIFYADAQSQITKDIWMIEGAWYFKTTKYDYLVATKQTNIRLSGDIR